MDQRVITMVDDLLADDDHRDRINTRRAIIEDMQSVAKRASEYANSTGDIRDLMSAAVIRTRVAKTIEEV